MQQDHHDDEEAQEQAWRSIVDNYGDRAELDDPPATDAPDASAPPAPGSTVPFAGRFGDPRAFFVDEQAEEQPAEPEDEGYVPPPPPPLPTLPPDRMAAWAGVFGSPAVLLCALILGISIPTWLGYLLILGFVGGFLYLVFKMPREPRDPWDDGAQV